MTSKGPFQPKLFHGSVIFLLNQFSFVLAEQRLVGKE